MEIENLSQSEELVLRIIKKNNLKASLPEMIRCLPRSADINEFKQTVSQLEEKKIIIKDTDGAYYISDKKPESEGGPAENNASSNQSVDSNTLANNKSAASKLQENLLKENWLKKSKEPDTSFNPNTGQFEESGKKEVLPTGNAVKFYKEKLKGHWLQSGASYANDDIFGLWLKEFNYSGIDGEVHTGKSTVGSFEYRVYITGNESGKCFLYVKGNPNGFCSTLGEIGFSDDYSFFTLSCSNSSFAFVKG